MIKKAGLLLLFLSNMGHAQQITSENYRARSESQLVEFEFVLPDRQYDFTGSDLLVKWHIIMFDLLEESFGYTPNVAARTLAYVNLAGYEAMLAGNSTFQSLDGQLQDFHRPDELNIDSTDFNAAVSVNNAVFYMVDKLFATASFVWMEKVHRFTNSVNDSLAANISPAVFQKSKEHGLAVAEWIYSYSKTDGGQKACLRSFDMNFRLPECEGCFEIHRQVDLENTGPMHPYWGNNRSFVAENNSDFNIYPKVPFSKYPNSDFYKMAKEVYDESKTVVPGNKKYIIANFWDDAAKFTYTAPGHSSALLTMVLRKNAISLAEAVEIYCKLNLAVNDAMISCWKAKYKHNLIRPVAYINRYIDSAWEPKILTPPFPEFPSGHSVQSAAMATVLTAAVGDSVSITDYSKFWVGEPRTFASFWEAAHEVSISRLYGGIHFKDALDQGQDMGKIIGQNILKLRFRREDK